jgi:hypothetical protein
MAKQAGAFFSSESGKKRTGWVGLSVSSNGTSLSLAAETPIKNQAIRAGNHKAIIGNEIT